MLPYLKTHNSTIHIILPFVFQGYNERSMQQEQLAQKKEECTMCKFTLVFAIVVALTVMVFTFFFKLNVGTKGFVPENVPELSSGDVDSRLAMLAEARAQIGATTTPEVASFERSIGVEPDYPFITYWQYPSPADHYAVGDKVFVRGQYQLPPDWIGSVTVMLDNEEIPERIIFSNAGRTATSTGTFAGIIQRQLAEGEHVLYLVVDAAAACAINGNCSRDSAYMRLGLEYPERVITIGPPKITLPAKTQ
jgi:hypothetical protein